MSNETTIIKEVSCKAGMITLRSDHILMFHPHDGITTCHISDLKEMYEIFMDLTNGIPHLYLSDNTNVKTFGAEERIYVSANFHHFASACAIKENSAIVRFITHTIIHFNKPQIPMKMFKTEQEGVNWLKSLQFNSL